MKSLWNDSDAQNFKTPLELRVYTSRLLGAESSLVLHGGGNTSVKDKITNLFGEEEEVLFVKGSGWDLATIEAEGFAPVKMDMLLKMAELENLSDSDMVKYQRVAMTNPYAPNPSIEAILHAIIPFKYVDHTHADLVVAITNTEGGEDKIREIYGDSALIIPYVMPGFILAVEVYKRIKNIDLTKIDTIILLNHGVFTFDDDAKRSYEKMIEVVSKAEEYIKSKGIEVNHPKKEVEVELLKLAEIRKEVSSAKGSAMVAKLDTNSNYFASLDDVASIATRGPLTPDHVIRTKKDACIIDEPSDVKTFSKEYKSYFDRNNDGTLTCLDLAPRWAVWKNVGTLAFGNSYKEASIIADIKEHTLQAIEIAERLGGYKALPEDEIFKMEYWELEQAKLKKGGSKPELQGKIAIVTGGASGIGKACVEELNARGASVVALDINPKVESLFNKKDILGLTCDVTKKDNLVNAVERCVREFGGIDILINNAGIFPPSMSIEDMDDNTWQKSLHINLTSHQQLLTLATPYLKVGVEPAVIFIASKNVPAPGVGASAYSVAKAGVTQLARIASMELAPTVRVNVLHPDAVFDTGVWSEDVIKKRAEHYGLSVDEYKRRNLLKVEVSSREVANLSCEMAGSLFAKITGAQLPIDGGNERVI